MQKELLSAYIDGEQVSNELSEEICQNADLQKSWANFHMIRSVMRQESQMLLGTGFAVKMEMLIEQEELKAVKPTISQPTPQELEKLPFMQKLKPLFSPMVQIAVAASVCLVAVVGVQTLNVANNSKNIPETPILQTHPFNNSVQEVSYNAPTRDVATSGQVEQKNKRIGAMLQNYELQRRVYADSLSLQSNNE